MGEFLLMASDGIADIVNDTAFQGSTDAAGAISSVVNEGFSFFISLVAFFMISVALLRNVLAGAYCAFPKFWDQVADAHRSNEKVTMAEALGKVKDVKQYNMSGIKQAIMLIIPNIKDMTEFSGTGEYKSAKNYFIKAIPEMLAVVCLGVFIYNGYWRDATSKVAGFGSEMFERILLQWDPVDAFDTMLNTAGRPAFATDNSLTVEGQHKNKMAITIYETVLGKFGDITEAAAKAQIAKDIDSAVETAWGMMDQERLADDTKYTYSVEARMVLDGTEFQAEQTTAFDKQWQFSVGIVPTGSNDGSEKASSGTIGNLTFETQKEARTEGWMVLVSVKSTQNTQGAKAGDLTGTLTIPNSDTFTLTIQGKVSAPEIHGYEAKTITSANSNKQETVFEYTRTSETVPSGTTLVTIYSQDGSKSVKATLKIVVEGAGTSATMSGSNEEWTISGSYLTKTTTEETEKQDG